MSELNFPVTEDELHAYVDGELPPERMAAVEAWLAAHPQDAARVQAWRSVGDALHHRFGGIADEPVPERLALERLAATPRRWLYGAAAAVLAAFIAGGGAGWLAHGATAAVNPGETLRVEALAAHRLYINEVRHPIEVRASEEHLLPWLSRRVGTPLRAPDLTAFGYKLLGGRLLPGMEAPAALFMYETGSGERLTLYCTPLKAASSGLFYTQADKAASVQWVDANYGWVMSGPANRDDLKAITMAAYEQIEASGSRTGK